MGLKSHRRGGESRFSAYVEALTSALGHADRAVPFHSYCAGLLLPGDRKSVEPMAASVHPGRVQAAQQSLHHFVAKSDWSDDTVLAAARARVLPLIAKRGPIRALIIDDTGIGHVGDAAGQIDTNILHRANHDSTDNIRHSATFSTTPVPRSYMPEAVPLQRHRPVQV